MRKKQGTAVLCQHLLFQGIKGILLSLPCIVFFSLSSNLLANESHDAGEALNKNIQRTEFCTKAPKDTDLYKNFFNQIPLHNAKAQKKALFYNSEISTLLLSKEEHKHNLQAFLEACELNTTPAESYSSTESLIKKKELDRLLEKLISSLGCENFESKAHDILKEIQVLGNGYISDEILQNKVWYFLKKHLKSFSKSYHATESLFSVIIHTAYKTQSSDLRSQKTLSNLLKTLELIVEGNNELQKDFQEKAKDCTHKEDKETESVRIEKISTTPSSPVKNTHGKELDRSIKQLIGAIGCDDFSSIASRELEIMKQLHAQSSIDSKILNNKVWYFLKDRFKSYGYTYSKLNQNLIPLVASIYQATPHDTENLSSIIETLSLENQIAKDIKKYPAHCPPTLVGRRLSDSTPLVQSKSVAPKARIINEEEAPDTPSHGNENVLLSATAQKPLRATPLKESEASSPVEDELKGRKVAAQNKTEPNFKGSNIDKHIQKLIAAIGCSDLEKRAEIFLQDLKSEAVISNTSLKAKTEYFLNKRFKTYGTPYYQLKEPLKSLALSAHKNTEHSHLIQKLLDATQSKKVSEALTQFPAYCPPLAPENPETEEAPASSETVDGETEEEEEETAVPEAKHDIPQEKEVPEAAPAPAEEKNEETKKPLVATRLPTPSTKPATEASDEDIDLSAEIIPTNSNLEDSPQHKDSIDNFDSQAVFSSVSRDDLQKKNPQFKVIKPIDGSQFTDGSVLEGTCNPGRIIIVEGESLEEALEIECGENGKFSKAISFKFDRSITAQHLRVREVSKDYNNPIPPLDYTEKTHGIEDLYVFIVPPEHSPSQFQIAEINQAFRSGSPIHGTCTPGRYVQIESKSLLKKVLFPCPENGKFSVNLDFKRSRSSEAQHITLRELVIDKNPYMAGLSKDIGSEVSHQESHVLEIQSPASKVSLVDAEKTFQNGSYIQGKCSPGHKVILESALLFSDKETVCGEDGEFEFESIVFDLSQELQDVEIQLFERDPHQNEKDLGTASFTLKVKGVVKPKIIAAAEKTEEKDPVYFERAPNSSLKKATEKASPPESSPVAPLVSALPVTAESAHKIKAPVLKDIPNHDLYGVDPQKPSLTADDFKLSKYQITGHQAKKREHQAVSKRWAKGLAETALCSNKVLDAKDLRSSVAVSHVYAEPVRKKDDLWSAFEKEHGLQLSLLHGNPVLPLYKHETAAGKASHESILEQNLEEFCYEHLVYLSPAQFKARKDAYNSKHPLYGLSKLLNGGSYTEQSAVTEEVLSCAQDLLPHFMALTKHHVEHFVDGKYIETVKKSNEPLLDNLRIELNGHREAIQNYIIAAQSNLEDLLKQDEQRTESLLIHQPPYSKYTCEERKAIYLPLLKRGAGVEFHASGFNEDEKAHVVSKASGSKLKGTYKAAHAAIPLAQVNNNHSNTVKLAAYKRYEETFINSLGCEEKGMRARSQMIRLVSGLLRGDVDYSLSSMNSALESSLKKWCEKNIEEDAQTLCQSEIYNYIQEINQYAQEGLKAELEPELANSHETNKSTAEMYAYFDSKVMDGNGLATSINNPHPLAELNEELMEMVSLLPFKKEKPECDKLQGFESPLEIPASKYASFQMPEILDPQQGPVSEFDKRFEEASQWGFFLKTPGALGRATRPQNAIPFLEAARNSAEKHNVIMRVTDLSYYSLNKQPKLPEHSASGGHSFGGSIDVSPINDNNSVTINGEEFHTGGASKTYKSPGYNRERTFLMLKEIIDAAPERIEWLLFNDKVLVDRINKYYKDTWGPKFKEMGIRKDMTIAKKDKNNGTLHDNHIDIRYTGSKWRMF